MDLDKFYAISKDTAPLYEGDNLYREVKLYQYNLGKISFPEKVVGVSDGIILLDPLEFPAPSEEAELWVTLADVSEAQDKSHMRSAYLSVLFSHEAPAAFASAITVNGKDNLGIPVDSGTVGFYPPAALLKLDETSGFDQEDFSEELIAALFESDKMPEQTLLYDLATVGGEGFVGISSSGWGDGVYGVDRTLDSKGNVIGYHVNFGVVGVFDEEEAENTIAEDKTEVDNLKNEVSTYGALWPVFLIIGFTFIIIGFSGNSAFWIIGIVFFVLSLTWISIANQAKEKLKAKEQSKSKDS